MGVAVSVLVSDGSEPGQHPLALEFAMDPSGEHVASAIAKYYQ
jgi:hypothetical protein